MCLSFYLANVFLMFDWGYQPYGHNITEVPISSPNTGGYMKSQDITGVPGWAACGGGGELRGWGGGHSLLPGVLSRLWALVPLLIFLRDH